MTRNPPGGWPPTCSTGAPASTVRRTVGRRRSPRACPRGNTSGAKHRLPLASRGPAGFPQRCRAGPARRRGSADRSRRLVAANVASRGTPQAGARGEQPQPPRHGGAVGRRAEVRQPRRAAPTQRGRARGCGPPQRDQGGNRARKPGLARRRRATSSRRREQAQRHDAARATDPVGVAEGAGTGAVRVRAGPPRGRRRVVGGRPARRGQARRRQAAGSRVRTPRRSRRSARRGRRAALPPVTVAPDGCAQPRQHRRAPERLRIRAEGRHRGRHERRPRQRPVPPPGHCQGMHGVVHQRGQANRHVDAAQLGLSWCGLGRGRLQRVRQAVPVARPSPSELGGQPGWRAAAAATAPATPPARACAAVSDAASAAGASDGAPVHAGSASSSPATRPGSAVLAQRAATCAPSDMPPTSTGPGPTASRA